MSDLQSPINARVALRSLLAASLVAVFLIWTSGPAAGQARSAGTTTTSKYSPAQVLAYWTKARMARARSADLSVAPVHILPGGWSAPLGEVTRTQSRSAPAMPFSARGVADESNQTAYKIYSAGWTHYKVVGRLYFMEPDGNEYTCTGTVVSRNIVVTAGHCAYTAGVGWNSMEMFVPDKYGSSTPYGSWAIATLSTWPRWKQSGWFPQDYAFLKIAPDAAGRQVGDVTGWAGMVMNATTIGDIWSIGYPRTGFFRTWDGEYGFYCYSPYSSPSAVADSDGVTGYDIGYGCYMTGGASGGPMFVYSQGSWFNVVSVNSHCWPVGCTAEGSNVWSRNLWGPYFDDDTASLFQIAQNS
jgi:V8-like Glu-specific endopeptidase